jgi:hypothetical protein
MFFGDGRVHIDARLLSSMQFGEKFYEIENQFQKAIGHKPSWVARVS